MNEKKSLRALMGENPMILLFLGACPALGATGDVRSALGMSCAVLLVMLLSSLVLGLLRKLIPEGARVLAAVLVVAGFASIVQLMMNALLPTVYQMLGLYLTVAAVDILILADSEEAAEQTLGAKLLQSLLAGLVFALLLLATAVIRELFGSGSLAGFKIPVLSKYNVPVLIQPAGGFAVLGLLAAVVNKGSVTRGVFQGFAMKAAGLQTDEPEKTEEEEAAK